MVLSRLSDSHFITDHSDQRKLQPTCRIPSVKYSNTISKYRLYHNSQQIIRKSCRFPYLYSPRTNQTSRRLICSVATESVSESVEESKMEGPKEIFLKDYKLPDYYFDTVDLSFSLGEEKTIVCAKINVVPRVNGVAAPLALDGVDLKLISVKINGIELKVWNTKASY
ncbi:unnamed protein product [Lactuca virosa]|uniref:Uncharacterized protein n=1 Tax=Lactuca virosa TaxID=75947 RepID=A0AAU9N9C6_9ASTR|nr:unnamed protein product [Lactuca virosa]